MITNRSILVDVRDAGRTYALGGTVLAAVAHATCQISGNDRIAVVGRSGSGKSTFLHLIAGLETPTSGVVSWPALGARETLRPKHVGIVFQSPSLIPWLDVAENVALPLQLAGRGFGAQQVVKAALRRFDLDHLASKLPEELSGGQAQRVSLVRATVTSPALLIADEPTGQLDHSTAAHLLDILLAWADEEHTAIVVATHDITVAERLATRWQMHRGVLTTELERLAS
ncbi:ABC transporter ATP-binding protein [Devosia sp.]|uniref:ABC transporter ATP-binding protein n=1 Tax=Devosia sp. TaxID=1871048 RepID=UPI003BAB8539